MVATATATAPATGTDRFIELKLRPGTYRAFVASLAEGGPLLKCYKGSVKLVSPGRSHEYNGRRLSTLILAGLLEFKIPHTPLGATRWDLPEGTCLGTGYEDDTGYEADESYLIQHYGREGENLPPDLVVEIVVSHDERKAICAGEALKIPELWVLDLNHARLTFFALARQGKHKGTYRPTARSRALPMLTADAVRARLCDEQADVTAFHEDCRRWAREVLLPRFRKPNLEG
jgi:Uma2 family endonuclease